jgi:HSP20 family protein
MMTFYVSPNHRIARRRTLSDRRWHSHNHKSEALDREKILSVDVISDDESYTISAMVPGIEAEDIKVEILNKTVSITGEFNEDIEDENEKYLVNELPFGRFGRVLTLPIKLDPAKADANLKNGVFTLRVPKAEDERPKAIKISAD